MVLRTLKSSVIKGYDNIGFLMLANLLFVAGSVLIITIPVSVLIFSSLTGALIKGNIPDFRSEVKRARQYWVRGGMLALISLLITAIFVADCYILLMVRKTHPWLAHLLLGLVLCLLIIWLLMQIYMIPMFLSQRLLLIKTFKRSFLLVIDNFGISLAFAGIFLLITALMLVSGVGTVLFMFGLHFLLQNQIFVNIMEKYHGQHDSG
jgi:uncharacterized membrane protein YesL